MSPMGRPGTEAAGEQSGTRASFFGSAGKVYKRLEFRAENFSLKINDEVFLACSNFESY